MCLLRKMSLPISLCNPIKYSMSAAPVSLNATTLQAPWRDAWLILLLAPALIAGCYSAGFLNFDDDAHYKHELMRPGVPLSDFWKRTENTTYFPVTILSYRFDRWLYERVLPQPWPKAGPAPGVRFTSLLLHMLAGIFLWRALLHLKFGRWLSLFVAAAWTVHPTACESVCWISERKNVLAGFFGFASLAIYFNRSFRLTPRLFLTAALFLLALLSKPTAAGFLPLYFLYDILLDSAPHAGTPAWKRWLPRGLFYAALVCIMAGLANLNIDMARQANVRPAGGSYFSVALTGVPILVRYLFNALLPFSLSIFYYNPIVASLGDSLFWTSLLILIASFAASLWAAFDRRQMLFLWGWFMGALGPALNIIPIPYLSQDRYAYFALPAILMIAAITISSLAQRVLKNYPPRLPALAALGTVAALALLTMLRSAVFQNDFVLFQDAVAKQPQSSYAHMHFALALSGAADVLDYAGAGDAETIAATRREALNRFTQAAQSPDFDRMLEPGRVYILTGVLNERLGNHAAAYAILREQLAQPQKPYNSLAAWQSLARIELQRGHADVALQYVDNGLRAGGDPQGSFEMIYLKALCLEQLNRIEEAVSLYRSIPKTSLAHRRASERVTKLISASQKNGSPESPVH
jgi:tetratricopeptide (TPR) repeat protein